MTDRLTENRLIFQPTPRDECHEARQPSRSDAPGQGGDSQGIKKAATKQFQ